MSRQSDRGAIPGVPEPAQPNLEHGQQVFQQNCFSCHRIKSVGGNIGPNLDGVSSRGA